MKRFVTIGFAAFLLIAIAGMPLFAKGGSQGSSGKKQELHFLIWDDGGPTPKNNLRAQYTEWFNQNNPYNVTVVLDKMLSEDTKVALPTRVAANDAPDIFMAWAGDYLRSYYEAGKMLDITSVFNGDPQFKAQFSDYALEALTFPDGKIYGFPGVIVADFAFINKKILDQYNLQVPLNFDDYVALGRALKSANPRLTPLAVGNKPAWPLASFSEMVVDRLGGNNVIPDIMAGRRNWTDPVFVNTVNRLKQLAPYFPEGYNGLGMEDWVNEFIAGNAAVLINTSGFVTRMLADVSKVKDDIIVQPHPLFPDGRGSSKGLIGQASDNYIISKSCKNVEAAIAYCKGFYSKEWQQRMVDIGEIPPFKSGLLDLGKMPSITKQVYDHIAQSTSMQLYYDLVFGPVVGVEYNNVIQSIMNGSDATAAFARFDQFYKQNYTPLK